METADLIEGKQYLVKHYNGKAFVRRLFKYREKRFNDIECFVFTGKVSKNITAKVDSRDSNGNPLYQYSYVSDARTINALFPSQEISIPYYDLKQIKEA